MTNPRGTTVRSAALAKQAPTVTRQDAIAQIVRKHQGNLAAVLPSGMDAERFGRLLLMASSNTPALMKVDPVSFLAAGVTAAQLGLEPNDPRGLAYIVPRKGRAALMIGYRGYLDLARRSGMVGAINAFPVYEGDEFRYTLGLEPTLHHIPDPDGEEDPAKLTHVYAIAKVNGEPQFVVLTRRQVEKARNQSDADTHRPDSPWTKWYVEMAQKTALKRLCKYLPMTVELATAYDRDDASLTLGDLSAMSGVADDEDVIPATSNGPDDRDPRNDRDMGRDDGPDLANMTAEDAYWADSDHDEPDPAA